MKKSSKAQEYDLLVFEGAFFSALSHTFGSYEVSALLEIKPEQVVHTFPFVSGVYHRFLKMKFLFPHTRWIESIL